MLRDSFDVHQCTNSRPEWTSSLTPFTVLSFPILYYWPSACFPLKASDSRLSSVSDYILARYNNSSSFFLASPKPRSLQLHHSRIAILPLTLQPTSPFVSNNLLQPNLLPLLSTPCYLKILSIPFYSLSLPAYPESNEEDETGPLQSEDDSHPTFPQPRPLYNRIHHPK